MGDTLITRLPFCKACDGCVEHNQCVTNKEYCCSMGSHYTLECAGHSATHPFRCGCLPDGACRLDRPLHLNHSVGTEDCCSLEDHATPAPTPAPAPPATCHLDSCSIDTHPALDVLEVADQAACCAACLGNSQCAGWIWKHKKNTNKFCHLKKNRQYVKTGCTGEKCTPCGIPKTSVVI